MLEVMMHWFLLMLKEGGVSCFLCRKRENRKDQASLDSKGSRQFRKRKTDCKQGNVMHYLVSSVIELDMDFSK